MKVLIVGFLLIGCTFALPQYNAGPTSSSSNNRRPPIRGQNNLPRGCTIKYITVSEVIEVESVKQECRTVNERVCETKQRRKCSPQTKRECHTEYVEQCETKYEKQCQQLYREVDEYVEVDDCQDKYVRKCESHWVEYGPGDKRWEEDPTRCQQLPETECKTKRQTRKKKVPYQACKNVPRKDCKKRPIQKCQNIVNQVCKNEPYQDCRNVPREECNDKHIKKPKTVTKNRPIRVCEDGDGGYLRTKVNEDGEEIDEGQDFEISGAKNEDDPVKIDKVSPRVVFGD